MIGVSLVSLRSISSLVCKEKRCFAALCMTGVGVSLLTRGGYWTVMSLSPYVVFQFISVATSNEIAFRPMVNVNL